MAEVGNVSTGVLFCILSLRSAFRSQLSGECLGHGAGGLRLLGRCRGREGGEKGQAVTDEKAWNCDGSQG